MKENIKSIMRIRLHDKTETCMQTLMAKTGLSANQLINNLIQESCYGHMKDNNDTQQQQ